MKKILIVGSIDDYDAAIEKLKKELDGELSVTRTETMNGINHNEYDIIICEMPEKKKDEYIIYNYPPDIEMPFIPKRKHSPKGHQRPYKYHP